VTSRRSLPPGSRGLRLSDEPVISVVLASRQGRPQLEERLAVLAPACAGRAVELVVARACPVTEFRALQQAWPTVLWMPAPDSATPAQLRAAGMSAAEGDVVGLLDDTTPADEDWVAELHLAPRRSPVAGRG
jgi:hypothetical protein